VAQNPTPGQISNYGGAVQTGTGVIYDALGNPVVVGANMAVGAGSGKALVSDASGNLTLGTVGAASLPSATTTTQGAVILDGTATDIANTGTQAAGSIGKAADAGHVHFSSGMFLCAPTQYAPAMLDTLSVSSLTFAAFSSSNVNTGSFTAPASGNVLVTASFVTVQATGTAAVAFALAAHGTVSPLVGNAIQGSPANTSANQPTVIRFLVTGLTPGNSYNLDLLGATGNVSDALEILALQMTATTITSGNRGGPVVMTVQAV